MLPDMAENVGLCRVALMRPSDNHGDLSPSGDELQVREIGVDYDFPKEYLPLLLEVFTGTVMDDMGNVTSISLEERLERKDQYIEIAEKHIETCQFEMNNLYLKQK